MSEYSVLGEREHYICVIIIRRKLMFRSSTKTAKKASEEGRSTSMCSGVVSEQCVYALADKSFS